MYEVQFAKSQMIKFFQVQVLLGKMEIDKIFFFWMMVVLLS